MVVGAAVLSHWVLDFIVHRPDLQLYPGGSATRRLGIVELAGSATIAAEVLCFGAGLWIYLSCTRARDKVGRYGFWALAAFLFFGWVSTLFAGAPPSVTALAWGRHRDVVDGSLGLVGGARSDRGSLRSDGAALVEPFILSFTLCASFSISSAFLTTSTDSVLSSVLSTYSFSSVASLSNFSVSRLRSAWRCLVGFLGHISFHLRRGLVFGPGR